MKILNAEQMREADRLTTERYGIPGTTLMENAGGAVMEYLRAACPELVLLCRRPAGGGVRRIRR